MAVSDGFHLSLILPTINPKKRNASDLLKQQIFVHRAAKEEEGEQEKQSVC